MTNPIELLLTLFIPTYMAGYLWLIKLARTDKPLYFLIESILFRAVIIVALGAVAFTVVYWSNEEKRYIHMVLFLMLAFTAWHAFVSRNFFRRITALPSISDKEE